MSRNSAKFIFLALILQLGACAISPQVERPAQPLGLTLSDSIEEASAADLVQPDEYRYQLAIGDELEVKYLQRLEYSTVVSVGPDGTISIPFLPAVRAEGLTLEELTFAIEQLYRGLLSESPAPESKRYLIGVGDVLEIRFPYVSQLTGTFTVRPDGRISLPLVASVIAEGKSPEALQQELVTLYEDELGSPELVLNVAQSRSNAVVSSGQRTRVAIPEMDSVYLTLRSTLEPKVYVGGEVAAPQAIRFEPRLSSLQAIVAAGGTTQKSELRNVIILRKGVDGRPKYLVRNLNDDLRGASVSEGQQLAVTNDILLHPFDVIIVPKTGVAKVSDALNAYLFDMFPMLRNSSIGFNYQIGTMEIEQDTNIRDPRLVD